MLKWLHANKCRYEVTETDEREGRESPCNLAAAGRHQEVLEWLVAPGYPLTRGTFEGTLKGDKATTALLS